MPTTSQDTTDRRRAAPLAPSIVTSISELSKAASTSNDLSGVIRAMAEQFRHVVGVGRCSIFLPGREEGLFRPSVSIGRIDYLPKVRTMVNGHDPYTVEILDRREPVVISDILKDPRVAKSRAQSIALQSRSMIGLPMLSGDKVVGLAYLDTEAEQMRFSDDQVAAAFQFGALAGTLLHQQQIVTEQQASLDRLQRENRALVYMKSFGERLDELTHKHTSVAAYADSLAQLLRRPVDIYDSSWRRLAHSAPIELVGRRTSNLATASLRAHPKVQVVLEAVRAGEVRTLRALPALGMDLRCVVAPVPLGESQWGALVVHETGRPFGAVDPYVIRQAGSRMGLLISSQNQGATTSQEIRSRLLTDMLKGDDLSSSRALAVRAEFAGLETGSPHVVVAVAGPVVIPHSTFQQLVGDVERVCGRGAVLANLTSEGAVALVPAMSRPGEATVASPIREVLDRLAAERPEFGPLTIAVSAPFEDLGLASEAHLEAQQVLRCVRRFGRGTLPPVLEAHEFGAGLALVTSADVEEMVDFARRLFKAALQDADGEGTLLATVRAFLEGMNVRQAARILNVHENTIRHRLGNLEKTTGLSLITDTKAQVKADLAMLVLRLIGDCPWQREVLTSAPVSVTTMGPKILTTLTPVNRPG